MISRNILSVKENFSFFHIVLILCTWKCFLRSIKSTKMYTRCIIDGQYILMINWKTQLTLLEKIANFPSNLSNVSGRRLWDKLRLSGGRNRPPVAEAKCRMACGAFFNTLDQAQKLRIKFSKKAVLRLRRPLHWEIYGIRNKHPLVCCMDSFSVNECCIISHIHCFQIDLSYNHEWNVERHRFPFEEKEVK